MLHALLDVAVISSFLRTHCGYLAVVCPVVCHCFLKDKALSDNNLMQSVMGLQPGIYLRCKTRSHAATMVPGWSLLTHYFSGMNMWRPDTWDRSSWDLLCHESFACSEFLLLSFLVQNYEGVEHLVIPLDRATLKAFLQEYKDSVSWSWILLDLLLFP